MCTGIGQLQAGALRGFQCLGYPDYLIKSFGPSMQVIFSIVLDKWIFLTIQAKFTAGNTIPISSNQRPKKRIPLNIRLKAVESQYNVLIMSLPVRCSK
jgi:hypothetical protein